jgi:SAM-dependent methyltransferase
MAHMDAKWQTVDTYNRSAEALARKFNAIGGRVENIDKVFSLIAKERPFAFEIGCGNGRDAAEILKRTDRYLGIDISEKMIGLARVQAPGGAFEVADIESYEVPEGIDAAFSFASLLHSDKAAVSGVFARVHAALSGGGLFFVSLKNAPYQERVQIDEFGTRTFYYYALDDIRELAGEGFKLLWQDEPVHGRQKWADVLLQKFAQ